MPRDHEHDEPFQDVVAERALELRDKQPPEAAQTAGRVRSRASGVGDMQFGHGIQTNRSDGQL